MTDNEISAYAIAKICVYNDSFENFKLLYNQYCDEISNSNTEHSIHLAKVEAVKNPFRTGG